jgi:hypothetical protein
VSAAAHQLGDEPIDPAEAEMPAAAFQAIERAHQLCDHPAARELSKSNNLLDLELPISSLTAEPDLIAHATKILRSQIRAGELVAEMKARGDSDLIADEPTVLFSLEDFKLRNLRNFKFRIIRDLNLPVSAPDESITDWALVAADAWNAKSWKGAATERGKRRTIVEIEPEKLRRLRALLDDDVSLQRAYAEISSSHIKGRAADSTLEALAFQLRAGVGVLKEQDVRRRLSALSDAQLVEIVERVQRHKPEIAPVWSDDDVITLMKLREALR